MLEKRDPVSVSRARGPWIVAFSMAAAPVLLLASDAAALAFGRPAFWFATITMWFSFFFFVVAAYGLMELSGRSAAAVTGTLVTILGCLAGATIMGLERMIWSMVELGMELDVAREVAMEPLVFVTSRATGLTFPIGLLILTFAAARARVLAGWQVGLLALGAILFPVGRIVVGLTANVASDVLMSLVLVPLAFRASRADAPEGGGAT